jgi:hypothetical protein
MLNLQRLFYSSTDNDAAYYSVILPTPEDREYL